MGNKIALSQISLQTPQPLALIPDPEQNRRQKEDAPNQQKQEEDQDLNQTEKAIPDTDINEVNFLKHQNTHLRAENQKLKYEWNVAIHENWILHDRIANLEESYEDKLQKLMDTVAMLQTIVVGEKFDMEKRDGCEYRCMDGVKKEAEKDKSVEAKVVLEEEEDDEWVLAGEEFGEAVGVGESEEWEE